jgi:hypothetical protein
LMAAAPAAAQVSTSVNANAHPGIQNRIGQLQTRFQAGLQQGTISRREAWPLRQQMDALVALEAQYRADGLSRQERTDLRQRIRSLHQEIRVADGGAYDRMDRYADVDDDFGDYASNDRVDRNYDGFDDRDVDRDGRWDDDVQAGRSRADLYATNDRIDANRDGFDDRDVDRDGRWDDDVQAGRSRADLYATNDRIDANRDGFDDRDTDRDGRWDDDVNSARYTGQGGPVEGNGWVVDETGGRTAGVPGLIGSFLGIGGLQVGQRASANLYAVPYEYRDQFRDSSNVYFRSDGRRIYEIDARTQTILRVYNREAE